MKDGKDGLTRAYRSLKDCNVHESYQKDIMHQFMARLEGGELPTIHENITWCGVVVSTMDGACILRNALLLFAEPRFKNDVQPALREYEEHQRAKIVADMHWQRLMRRGDKLGAMQAAKTALPGGRFLLICFPVLTFIPVIVGSI